MSALDRLSATGKPPPTATRTASGSRTGKTARPGSQMQPSDIKAALTAELVQKMRQKFHSAFGSDIKTQELITAEVTKFMSQGGSVHERDLAMLEERIRNRLFGVPQEVKLTRVPMKVPVETDEWATLTQYEAAKTEEEKKERALKMKTTQKGIKTDLDKQMDEMEQKRKDEEAYENRMYQMEHADYVKWCEEEAAKKEAKRMQVERLKMERTAQLEEQMRRRREYDDEKKKDDDEMKATMKLEYSRKIKEESKKFEKLQKEMVTLREANEEAKRNAASKKKAQIEEDLRFLKLQSDMYDEWEANRQRALDERKRLQDQQEVIAQGRAPAKRYIPDWIIEKNFQEHEKMLDEREASRKQAVKDRNNEMKQVLAKQLEEKLAAKAKAAEAEAERHAKFTQGISAAVAADVAKVEKQKMKRLANRDDLMKQMEENARRAKNITMSDTEKSFNKNYLEQVNTYLEKTGKPVLG
ncbi:trichohyalin-plectin-homology domain-containing protein [Pseudoscourfieldia marina]